MKRVGYLLDEIAARENLLLAFAKARRGRRDAADIQRFGARLDDEVEALRRGLLAGDVELGRFRRFEIRDPKPRVIHAPVFRERVLHHAIWNVLEPVMERVQVFESFACRKKKGTFAALEHARGYVRRYAWVLKGDVRKYFDSIDHAILLARLERLLKDRPLLALLERLVRSYECSPGKGLPIGALSSQHLANFYLTGIDHRVKETLRIPGYVRYMDDVLLFAPERTTLRAALDDLRETLGRELALELISSVLLVRTAAGINFLGYRVTPERLRLTAERKRRFAAALRNAERAYARGEWDEATAARRVAALLSHVERAETRGLRRKLLGLASPAVEDARAARSG